MDDEDLVQEAEKLIERFQRRSSAKDFIESMREALDEWGELTEAQHDTLETIVEELRVASKNQGRTDWDSDEDEDDEDEEDEDEDEDEFLED